VASARLRYFEYLRKKKPYAAEFKVWMHKILGSNKGLTALQLPPGMSGTAY